MPKYKVDVEVSFFKSYEVEAEDSEWAEEIAMEKALKSNSDYDVDCYTKEIKEDA